MAIDRSGRQQSIIISSPPLNTIDTLYSLTMNAFLMPETVIDVTAVVEKV